jgi:magnesium transporter
VLWANVVGALLPLLAARLKIDPTVISGPLMSTLVDATGLFIYLAMARAILSF